MSMRIDSHHHLWRYDSGEFGWISDDMSAIRRDFLPGDLASEISSAHVDGTVVVQARQSLEETHWLLSLARTMPKILGVVGWLPLSDPEIATHLEQYSHEALLKGLRHVVQAEADGFLDGPAFNRGVSLLKDARLVYDILIVERQLEEAIRFVDRHPKQIFVLDHIAKPRIAAGAMEPWRTSMHELGRRKHVTCKISGMVTEAQPAHWSPSQLRPYFDVALEAFGPSRLMIGTDWPVLTIGCRYERWWRIVEEWIAPLTETERNKILGETALQVYGLEVASPGVASACAG